MLRAHKFLDPRRGVHRSDDGDQFGVVVEQRFRRRFYAHDRIEALELSAERVELVLTDGARVPAKARHLTADQQIELRARFDEARRAFDGGDAEGGALSLLDRGGRSGAAWREALGAVLAQASAYRGRALTREDLFGVLKAPVRRIGAPYAAVPYSKPLENEFAPDRNKILAAILELAS